MEDDISITATRGTGFNREKIVTHYVTLETHNREVARLTNKHIEGMSKANDEHSRQLELVKRRAIEDTRLEMKRTHCSANPDEVAITFLGVPMAKLQQIISELYCYANMSVEAYLKDQDNRALAMAHSTVRYVSWLKMGDIPTIFTLLHPFNLNDEFLVRLTPAGESRWADHWNEYSNTPIGVPDAIRKTATCMDGRVCFKLHEIMQIFGRDAYMGSNRLPFVNNEIAPKKG